MLSKVFQRVYHPPVQGVPYRPYSKTCPPPATSSGSSSLVCGTYSIDISLVTVATGYSGAVTFQRVQTTTYSVPGVSIPAVSVILTDPNGPIGHVGGGAYCTRVTTK